MKRPKRPVSRVEPAAAVAIREDQVISLSLSENGVCLPVTLAGGLVLVKKDSMADFPALALYNAYRPVVRLAAKAI